MLCQAHYINRMKCPLFGRYYEDYHSFFYDERQKQNVAGRNNDCLVDIGNEWCQESPQTNSENYHTIQEQGISQNQNLFTGPLFRNSINYTSYLNAIMNSQVDDLNIEEKVISKLSKWKDYPDLVNYFYQNDHLNLSTDETVIIEIADHIKDALRRLRLEDLLPLVNKYLDIVFQDRIFPEPYLEDRDDMPPPKRRRVAL